MKNRRSTTSVFVFVLLVALAGAAEAEESTSCSALVDQMFALTGLPERIQKSMDGALRAARAADDTTYLTDEENREADRELNQAWSQELAPQNIVSSVRTSFLQHCDTAFLQSVIGQLQSSAVQPALQAERHSVLQQLLVPEVQRSPKAKHDVSSERARDKTAESEREPGSTPAFNERVALMTDLDRALKMTDNAVELNVALGIAINQGVGIYRPPEDNDVELQRAGMRAAHRKAILKLNLLLYRNLTDDQLRAYIAVSGQKTLREFNNQLNEYLTNALKDAAIRLGERVRAVGLKIGEKREQRKSQSQR